jgi:predicted amidohydrolase
MAFDGSCDTRRVRVAAYQAPYLPFGSFEAVGLIRDQLALCEARGVEILCCPESVIGGLAHESDGQAPEDVAIEVDSPEFEEVVEPLMRSAVTLIVGFTERGADGGIFSAAAVLGSNTLLGVYRKAFPGYRTVIRAGTELPIFHHGPVPFGVIICNDIWYLEPARILAARGAGVLFIPSNSGHLRGPSAANLLRARGENLPVARAVENTMAVVVADITGRQGNRSSLGCTRIVDPDGVVLAESDPAIEGLVIADVEPQRRHVPDRRGWDGGTNLAVSEAFLSLWAADSV